MFADVIQNSFKKFIMDGTIDLDTDTIKVMLLTSTHTQDQDTYDYVNDVSANEVTGTGYTAGGATITTPSVTQNNTDNVGVFDGADVTWASSTITARYACIYKDTGTPATSPIIAILDFGSDQSSSAGDFIIAWGANGILRLA